MVFENSLQDGTGVIAVGDEAEAADEFSGPDLEQLDTGVAFSEA